MDWVSIPWKLMSVGVGGSLRRIGIQAEVQDVGQGGLGVTEGERMSETHRAQGERRASQNKTRPRARAGPARSPMGRPCSRTMHPTLQR